MSRLEKPIDHDILWSTGDLVLWAELDLHLKDKAGNFHREPFLVDTGSNLSSMPASRARALDLPIPQAAVALPVNTPVGQVQMMVRSGLLRFQVEGMDATESVVPCHFLGDPDQAQDPHATPARLPRNLLGLAGVIDKLRFTFDGAPVSAAAPYGNLIVEKI
jgi:hypothetical protein